MSGGPIVRMGALDVRATSEPRFVRWVLIGVALSFLVLFVCLPVVAVFVQALSKGFGAYFGRWSIPMRGRPSGSRS